MKKMLLLCIILPFLFLSRCDLIFIPDVSGIGTFPGERNQIISSDDDIYISFDFDIARLSAEKILKIKKGEKNLEGIYTWEGNKLIFIPTPELIYGNKYILECKGTVKDKDEHSYKLNIEIPFFYITDNESPPAVVWVTPEGGQKVSSQAEIIINFSKPIDAFSFKEGFSLSPDTEHNTEWNASSTEIRISPQEKWNNLTLYKIRLSSSIKDSNGMPLVYDFETFFLVEESALNPEITGIEAAINDWDSNFPFSSDDLNEIKFDEVIKINFSEKMDEQKTENAFSLQPALAGQTVWLDEQRLLFIPEIGFTMDTQYTVSVGKTAENIHSNPLDRDYSVQFIPDIEILKVSSIKLVQDDITILDPDYSSDNPEDIDVSVIPYTYLFTISFNRDFETDFEKLSAQNNVDVSCIFPPGKVSPVAIGYNWLSLNTVDISFDGFKPKGSIEYLYVLEIRGGSNGIINKEGSFLEEDVRQLLRTR